MEQTIWQDSGIVMWLLKRANRGAKKAKTEKGDQTKEKRNLTEPCNMRQIIWDHKACIQQYLQRVMNTTGAIPLA